MLAYQSGRSTTEQVFAVKILAEKTITSENYDIFILMLDMSKAFDTVNRNKLMTLLESILSDCELHMMHSLINDVNLNVRLGNNVGENITTSVGICQGDCLSALLFIVYLASSIKPLPPPIQQVDCNRPLWSALNWLVDKDKHKVEIDPKYADDITFVRTDESKINQVERLMPEMLKENNLYVNPTKTEKYTISRTSNGSWKKKCKLLGSLLDSDKDIKRRKGLAIDSFKTLENIFKSRHIGEVIRLRIFKAYVESIFVYNSEIWTLTKSLEDKIDSFQRRLLQKVIRVNRPRLISNEDLYNRTHMKPGSVIIMKRRLSWFGHLMRLPPETPGRQSLRHFIKPVKRSTDRPKTTWLSMVLNDLKEHSTITIKTSDIESAIYELELWCSDRNNWNYIIHRTMLSKTTNVH